MATAEQLTQPDHRETAKMVVERFETAKDRHKAFTTKCERYYSKYRSYRELKRTYEGTKPRDVDELMEDAKTGFGADLFIPYIFSTIEATLPRMLSANPRMLIEPGPIREEMLPQPADLDALEDAAETIKLMLNKAQTKIDYPLILQDIGKSGLMYGLGVGKVYWREEWQKSRKTLEQATARQTGDAAWIQGEGQKLIFDGPMAECVDVFDFIWDPAAWDIRTARWVIHRTWRDNAYLRRLLEQKTWALPDGVTLEELETSGSETMRDDVWKERMTAAGYPTPQTRGDKFHEVWEFHDRERVVTLLDRAIPVQAGPNPFWHGDLPFSIYRPTRVMHEFVGIGEPEAIEDLQDELNALRSQRRDNAALVLQRPFAYFDGMVDPQDLVFGPGSAIPTDAPPQDVLFPLPLQDIPASSYNEEDRMQADIARVSGMDDSVAGSGQGEGGATETATGVQLVHAAANIRIQNKTRLLEVETVKHHSAQFLELFQQKITSTQYLPGPPKPGEAYKPWSWYQVDPAVMAGEWALEPEGGSMAPENIPQKRDDATRLWNMFQQDPFIRPDKVRERILELSDIKSPQSWIIAPGPQVPEEAIELMKQNLAQMGVPPEMVDQALGMAMQMMQQAGSMPPGQPGMNGNGGPPPGNMSGGPQQAGPEPAAAGNPEE